MQKILVCVCRHLLGKNTSNICECLDVQKTLDKTNEDRQHGVVVEVLWSGIVG